MSTMIKLLGILVFVCLISMITQTAVAQPGLITIDENGNGTIFGLTLKSDMLQDLGPGGLPSTLTYLPLIENDFTPGDLLIYEPGGIVLSDVVRFNPPNAINPVSTIVFYSDPPESALEPSDLADVGFPTAFYRNTAQRDEMGTEENNWVDYTPLPGQPGFRPISPGITYYIISDVPEPSALVLLGMGALALAFHVRRRHKNRL